MSSGSGTNKRKDMDVKRLMMNDYDVKMLGDDLAEFIVLFHGPEGSLYAGGAWKVNVRLPDDYPYVAPDVRFLNKIYHPNIDEVEGLICLDVLLESWTPISDLLNIFEIFLPQLLLYPNESDPINKEAAHLMINDKDLYKQKVKEYCDHYAKIESISATKEESESSEISDGHYTSSGDDVPNPEDS